MRARKFIIVYSLSTLRETHWTAEFQSMINNDTVQI